ncbi:protein-glutamate methylesterase/protein-glutamine glutaminase [Frigidibacter sp. MR17.24]|uniref:protein-glutamate methylesterase/protein-glutamine glutaminase n=1 Tax=Frigidibacter sp. MR17.24 TaxID=3127345 RepID=UPI003012C671
MRVDQGPGRGPVRVLIVDDSRTIRQLIRHRLQGDPRLVVVGEAEDPLVAREMIRNLSPDVLTLDVEMPRMNGLEFLERLMRLRPMPVVMISTETHENSRSAIEALALGAVDCIGKPAADRLPYGFRELADILVSAAGARLQGRVPHRAGVTPRDFLWNGKMVLVGSSTGGVDALECLLRGFPADCPPTLITQHMPPAFLASFARRLDGLVAPRVALAEEGAPIRQGEVRIAPGGTRHLALAPGPTCRLLEGEKRSGHRPSVDILFESAVSLAPKVVATVLTGMGRDGAEGMAALRAAGARCLAQDQASSVVWGMPRAALEMGGAERAVPLARMSAELLALTGRQSARSGVRG